ncbi:LacI family DNA-binding transcriptional regulator [Paenibacillus caui]|uniref:LacI family DNA-binding transcriptional regulator n=1 Tax=Paenibacillus caui TaxID=2873927 RepID=UPI001CA9568F|nr:LacI family DNA-binding transcriptional regulator [Paenibacillus caui]
MTGKRITSMDVARRAGVSRSVVSAVINGTQGIGVSLAKREAVLKAMRELNYHVDASARAMKTGRSHCVAAFGDTSNALFLQLLEGLQQACVRLGYHVLLVGQGSGRESREELIALYLQRRVDGIISLDHPGYEDKAWANQVEQHRIPYVSVEGYAGSDEICSVLADYYGSVKTALQYLSTGKPDIPSYLRIAASEAPVNWAEKARLQAYLEFCAGKGAEPVVEVVESQYAARIRDILKRDIAAGRPLLYLSNWMDGALEIYRAAAELDLKIGRDVRVMSADNTYRVSRQLVPRLSVMAVPYKEMGEKAVEVLLEQIDRSEVETEAGASCKHWIEAQLISGESV